MSSARINFVDEINMSKETWRIEVRILRLWPTYFKKTPTKQSSIEFVCEDEKAGQIQASVPFFLFGKFQQRLVEGSFYRINNFEIQQNEHIQATAHTYKLQFHNSTGVRPLQNPLNIPRNRFRFVEINDILSGEIGVKILVDVIAEVIECGELNDTDKDKIRTTAKLRDDLGETISCTLWSPFAEDLVNRWGNTDESRGEPLICILQYALISDFRGRSISNSMYASRLLFDQNIPEIKEFKSKINDPQRVTIERSFTTISSSSRNGVDDFNMKLELLGIKYLDAIQKEGYFYVYGKILSIATAYGWFYMGCKEHGKKIDEDTGKLCTKCKEKAEIEARYKLTVRVEDDSGVGQFVMFDDHIMPIVKISAAELKKALEKDDDFDSFPDELDQLLDRKCIFKVEVQKFNIGKQNRIYTIKSVSEDPDIINKIVQDKSIVGRAKNLLEPFNEVSSIGGAGDSNLSIDISTPTQKRMSAELVDVSEYDQSVTSKIQRLQPEIN